METQEQPLIRHPNLQPDHRLNEHFENIARLVRTNPALLSLLYSIGIDAFAKQFLALFRESGEEALYIREPLSIALGTYGWVAGAYLARHPNQNIRSRLSTNIINVLTINVGFVFAAISGASFEIFCTEIKHLQPDELCEVSYQEFLTQFITMSAALSIFYTGWDLTPASVKTALSKRNTISYTTVAVLEAFYKTLVYSRGLSFVLRNGMHLTNSYSKTFRAITYEYLAIPVAILAFLIETFKPRYSQRIESLMLSIITISLMLYKALDLEAEFKSLPKEQLWAPILMSTVLNLQLISGILFTALHAKEYLNLRRKSFAVIQGGPQLPYVRKADEQLEGFLNGGSPQNLSPVSTVNVSLETQGILHAAIQDKILTLAALSGFEIQKAAEQFSPYQAICRMNRDELLAHEDYQQTTQTVLRTMAAIQYRILELQKCKFEVPEDFVPDQRISSMTLHELLQDPTYKTITQAMWYTVLAIQCRMLELLKRQVVVPQNFQQHQEISNMALADLLQDSRYKAITQAVSQTFESQGLQIVVQTPTDVLLHNISRPGLGLLSFSRNHAYGATHSTSVHPHASTSDDPPTMQNPNLSTDPIKRSQP